MDKNYEFDTISQDNLHEIHGNTLEKLFYLYTDIPLCKSSIPPFLVFYFSHNIHKLANFQISLCKSIFFYFSSLKEESKSKHRHHLEFYLPINLLFFFQSPIFLSLRLPSILSFSLFILISFSFLKIQHLKKKKNKNHQHCLFFHLKNGFLLLKIQVLFLLFFEYMNIGFCGRKMLFEVCFVD